MSRLRRLTGRAGYGLADQAFSSLTNFALTVVVARSLDVEAFGAFMLAFSTYIVALNVSRALATEPFAVRFSGASEATWRRAAGQASGTALAAGVVMGSACLVAGALRPDGPLAPALNALGLVLPGLLLQDSWRFVFFAAKRGGAALLNDVSWALVLFPALVVLDAVGQRSVFSSVLAWGGAATVAAVVGALQSRVLPRPLQALVWYRAQRDLALRYLGEHATFSGAQQAALYGIGAVAGLPAVGAVRAARVVLGPLRVLYVGAQLMAIPAAAGLWRRDPARLVPRCAGLSAALAVAALAIGAALLLLPDSLGTALLGATWDTARDVLAPTGLALAGSGVLAGAFVGLRALGAAGTSLRSRIASSLTTLVAGVAGAALAGAPGAAWGFAVASAVGAAIWWRSLLGAVTAARRAPTGSLAAVEADHDPVGRVG